MCDVGRARAGKTDGDAIAQALFDQPIGLAVLSDDVAVPTTEFVDVHHDYQIFVADWGNGLIRRISTVAGSDVWTVSTIAGSSSGPGAPVDGAGLAGAVLAGPTNLRVVYHPNREPHVSLLFTDRNPNVGGAEVGAVRVLQLYSDYGVRTIAGSRSGRGDEDGRANVSKVSGVWGVAANSMLAVITEGDTGSLKTVSLDEIMLEYPCDVGQYQSGGSCVACSGGDKPPGALFVTNGGHYDSDSCEWECPSGTEGFNPRCFYPEDIGEPDAAQGRLFTTDRETARSHCSPGYTTNDGDLADPKEYSCRPAGVGFYSPGGTSPASQCPEHSTTLNNTARAVGECICEAGRFMNAQFTACELCSQGACEPGVTRSACTAFRDSTCSVQCSNPAGSANSSFRFVGPGSWDLDHHVGRDDCEYECVAPGDGTGFWRDESAGGFCRPCVPRTCPWGEYTVACTKDADNFCTPCTNAPTTAGSPGVLAETFNWESAGSSPLGDPAKANDCQFRCAVEVGGRSGYYLASGTNTSGTCEACSEELCAVGFYRGQCQQSGVHSKDALCYLCVANDQANAHPVTSGEGSRNDTCEFECDAGFYLNNDRCHEVTYGATVQWHRDETVHFVMMEEIPTYRQPTNVALKSPIREVHLSDGDRFIFRLKALHNRSQDGTPELLPISMTVHEGLESTGPIANDAVAITNNEVDLPEHPPRMLAARGHGL